MIYAKQIKINSKIEKNKKKRKETESWKKLKMNKCVFQLFLVLTGYNNTSMFSSLVSVQKRSLAREKAEKTTRLLSKLGKEKNKRKHEFLQGSIPSLWITHKTSSSQWTGHFRADVSPSKRQLRDRNYRLISSNLLKYKSIFTSPITNPKTITYVFLNLNTAISIWIFQSGW